MDKIRQILTFFLFVIPLFFTKNTTKDPYLIQDLLFYFSIFFVYLFSFFIFIFNKEKKEQNFLKNFTKIEKVLFLFFSICFLSFFLAILKNKSQILAIILQGDLHLSWLITRSILIFFLPFIIPDQKFWINVLKIAIFTAFLSSLYGILQFFNIELFWNIDMKRFGKRIISTFGNPTFLSSYLVMTIPICFYFYKKTKKIFYLIIFGTLIFALILTYTRSSWLGIFFAGIYFVTLYFKNFWHKKNLKFFVKFLLLIFFLVSILFISKDFRTRIKESFSLSKNNKSIYQRLIIYKTGLDIFKDNIIFGSGYGTFDLKAPFYIGKYIDDIYMYEHKTHANLAHNLLLQVLSETGIVGIIIYLIFWFLFFKLVLFLIKNHKAQDEKFLILILSTSVFGMIIDNFLNVTTQISATMTLFWLIISIIIKIYKDNFNLNYFDNKAFYNEKNILIYRSIFFIFSLIVLGIITIRNTRIFISEKIFFDSVILTCDKDLNSLSPMTLLKSKKYILESNKYFLYRTTKLYELARINQKLGFLDESIDVLNKAILAHPGYSEFYLTNSINYFKKNMFKEAKQNLEMAKKIDPLNINTLLLMYTILKNEKNYTESIKILEKASTVEQKNPYIYNNLGVCYSYLNDFEKAKSFFLLANKFDPKITLIIDNIKKAENMQAGTFLNFELV